MPTTDPTNTAATATASSARFSLLPPVRTHHRRRLAGTAGIGLLSQPRPRRRRTRGLARLPLGSAAGRTDVVPNASNRTGASATTPTSPAATRNRAAVLDRIASMRIAYIRGMYTSDSLGDATAAQLRANNMGWVMTVYPDRTRHDHCQRWSPGSATSPTTPPTCAAPSRDPTSGTTPGPAAPP